MYLNLDTIKVILRLQQGALEDVQLANQYLLAYLVPQVSIFSKAHVSRHAQLATMEIVQVAFVLDVLMTVFTVTAKVIV